MVYTPRNAKENRNAKEKKSPVGKKDVRHGTGVSAALSFLELPHSTT
jgi:hypothetical protein